MKTLVIALLSVAIASAQVTIPDGTRLRVRLDQTLSSESADQGQTVELSVTEPVKVGDQVVIAEGARVTGTVTMAQEKASHGTRGQTRFLD